VISRKHLFKFSRIQINKILIKKKFKTILMTISVSENMNKVLYFHEINDQ
jgi:hypothetical protein